MRSGPNEETVARAGAPSAPDSDSSSTGCALGSYGMRSWADRSRIGSEVASPGCEIPVTSPLTSEMNTGTPASESWPARI